MTLKIRSLILLSLALTILTFVVPGCAQPPKISEKTEKRTVAVSIMPQKAFVEAVCGDLIDVVCMIPPGYSPEAYEPAPQEARLLDRSEIYFSIGVPAESAGILPLLEDSGIKVVDLAAETSKVFPDRMLDEDERDPHIWLSPKRVKVMADVIAREMAALDPENAGAYQAGKARFLAQLAQLDTNIRARFDGLSGKTFFVFHPSFGYLADDYGLEMVSLEQHGKEATPQHLQELIDLARTLEVQTVFAQAEIDSRQLDAFADETGCDIQILDPLSADYVPNLEEMAKAIAGALQNG